VEAHAKVGDNWVDLGLKCAIPHDICEQVTTDVPSQVQSSQCEVMCVS
jgi:5'-deoxynucleotidase YfbR-like HD superfamily hydrolase